MAPDPAVGTPGGAGLSARLWEANQDLARACLEHPFVQGLARGDLDREAYRTYVAQDAFFLRAFLRAYALGAARSGDALDRIRIFHELMAGVLQELELHGRQAADLGIDLGSVKPAPDTLAYTDFLLHCGYAGPLEVLLAALVPCMRLYAWLGSELARTTVPGNPYADWIGTYASGDFQKLARRLESLLEEAADEGPDVRSAYRHALVCELRFFGAPLRASRNRSPD